MEGSLFYWAFWSFWIVLTFIVKKHNPYRFKLSAAILIVLILANLHFSILGIDIYLSGLFLLALTYFCLYRMKRIAIIYFFICSFILTIAYVTFHLYEIFDPVMLIFNKNWMMGICLGYLAILLQKTLRERVLLIISGTMQGEILYTYILSKYNFPYTIGSLVYLDVLTLTSCLLIGWSCIEKAGSFLGNDIDFNQRGKQKSS